MAVEIEGVKRVALLDSGCQITVVPSYCVSHLKPRPTTRRLFGAGGHRIPIIGCVTLTVKVGDLYLEVEALVSRAVTEVMLGIDWLTRHNVKWGFGDGSVTLYGRQFLLSNETHSDAACRRCLIVDHDTCIPARSETNISANFQVRGVKDEPIKEDWATEPLELRKGLWVAGALLPRRFDGVPVRMMNLNNSEVMLRKGSEIAEAIPVQMLANSDAVEGPSPFAHLKPLMETVADDVTQEEKGNLASLLEEYSDVFSKSEFDLGCTGLAQHKIDTGVSRPIKQVLRRQPYAHVDIIDKQVSDMLRGGIIEPSTSPWVSNVVIVKKKMVLLGSVWIIVV